MQAQLENNSQKPRRNYRMSVSSFFSSPFTSTDNNYNKKKKVSWGDDENGVEVKRGEKIRKFKRYSLTPRRVKAVEKEVVSGDGDVSRRLFDENDQGVGNVGVVGKDVGVGGGKKEVGKGRRFSLMPQRVSALKDMEGRGFVKGGGDIGGIERGNMGGDGVMRTPRRSVGGGGIMTPRKVRVSTTPRKIGGGDRRRGRVSVRELEALEISDVPLGCEVVLTPVRASRKQQKDLGAKRILTPVRRSRRNSVRPSRAPSPGATTTMLEDTGYAFTPNRNIRKTRESDDEGDIDVDS